MYSVFLFIFCHFLTPQVHKRTNSTTSQLPLGTTIHESRSCSFSDIAISRSWSPDTWPAICFQRQPADQHRKSKKKSLAGPFSEVKIVCSNHQSQRHLGFQSPHVLSDLNRRTGSSVARDGLIPHLPVRLSAKARQNSREAAF